MSEIIKKQELLSISVSTGTYAGMLGHLLSLSGHGSAYCCVANVHMLVEGHKDPAFGRIVSDADVITPDGVPLSWALRLLYGIRQQRVAGMDLLPDLLKDAETSGVSVYFYGSTDDVLDKLKGYLAIQYPGLKLAGVYSPPFRPLNKDEEGEIINRINQSAPGIVFVVLGCPKQEKWMASMKGRVNALMIGVGGALPVLIGAQKRAPSWMQRYGLEWLYRLFQEPKRLFKRYFTTNIIFLGLLCRAFFRKLTGRPVSPKADQQKK